MRIEYSYGIFGYFLKYFGGVIMIALLGAFLFIAYLIPQWPVSWEAVFLAFLVLFMIPICCKGIYYLFKFNDSFVCNYIFINDSLTIIRKNKAIQSLSLDEVCSIVYLKLPKVIEVHFRSLSKPIVLMNNGQYETNSFVQLKDFLFKNNSVKVKWI